MRKILACLSFLAFGCGTNNGAPDQNTWIEPIPEIHPSDEPVADSPDVDSEPVARSLAVIPGELPDGVTEDVIAQLEPIEPSEFYSPLDAPVYGRSYSQQWPATTTTVSNVASALTEVQVSSTSSVSTDALTMGPFTYEVTSFDYVDTATKSGPLYIASLVIDGNSISPTSTGAGSGATVQISRTKKTVKVAFEVWGRAPPMMKQIRPGDSSMPGSLIDTYSITVDATKMDQEQCTKGKNGSVCWRARSPASPPVCFSWRAQYVDSGPWADFPSESFNVSRQSQTIPASYARVQATIEQDGVPSYQLTEVLDDKGCIAADDLPIQEQWTSGVSLAVFRLVSQFCYDSAGGKCEKPADSSNHAGVNIEVRSKSSSGPQSYCWAITDDAAKVPKGCQQMSLQEVRLENIMLVPPMSEVAQAAAVMSKILRREHDTAGGLGVELALAERRFAGTGYLTVHTEFACREGETGSCQVGNDLYLAPGTYGTVPSWIFPVETYSIPGTRFKFLIAHEFAHFVQANGQGVVGFDYYTTDDLTSCLCSCDHVFRDQNAHCLQGLEEPGAAQLEGFAHFFAAKVWNAGVDEGGGSCTFVYYKTFADDHELPGVNYSGEYPWHTEYLINALPVPVDCGHPVRWRDNHCLGDFETAYKYGTEYDWMGFYWAVNNNPDPAKRWSMEDIWDAYIAAAQSLNPNATKCTGFVSWEGEYAGVIAKNRRYANLMEGAQELKGTSSPAVEAFRETGKAYGVNTRP